MNVRTVTALIGMMGAVAVAQPATQPSTASQPVQLDFKAPVVRLWPNDPPATQPFDGGDKVAGRGKAGQPPNLWISKIEFPSLAVFLPESKSPTAAAVVCPGGGYAGQAYTKEGTDVAKALARNGVAVFVLKYRLPIGQAPAAGELPLPQQDVLRAIQVVRSRAAEWNVDPKRVGVVGFSAGGHLAATAATFYEQADTIAVKDETAGVSARPDFAVLIYPVISMTLPTTHAGSRSNLIGKTADANTEARFDPSQHVTPQTPPLLVVHAVDDKGVPVANAELMIAAARKAGIPHALLMYSHGGHGFGLGNNPENKLWLSQCVGWLQGQKMLPVE